jgi:hypothetical protein
MPRARATTNEEIAFIDEHRDSKSIAEMATLLGRSYSWTFRKAHRDGWQTPARITDRDKQQLAELAAKGLCNRCAGRVMKFGREVLRLWRRKLDLPPADKTVCPSCTQATRARTINQLARAGFENLAQVRSKAMADYVKRSGWPDHLRVRHVQILDALYMHGPQTRRQLAAHCGLQWRGSRQSLKSNDKGGTYLAHLIKLGMVIKLTSKLPPDHSEDRREHKRDQRGRSVSVYALTLGMQPKQATTEKR